MKRDRSSSTLIEVIVAAVLITVGIGGGIAGYNVASERIEIAHLENALLAEITEVSEYFASLDPDDPIFDAGGSFSSDFKNERLGRFNTEIEYMVEEKGTSDRPYKEITIRGNIKDKNISLVTKSIKVDTAKPIEVEICVPDCPDLWCGDDGCEGSCNCPSSHPVCGSDNWCSDSSQPSGPDDMFCVTSGPNAGTCDSSGTGNPCEDETDCEGDVPSTNQCTLQGTCEPGGTGNECTENADCHHYACGGNKKFYCTRINSPGENTCTGNSDCSYFYCSSPGVCEQAVQGRRKRENECSVANQLTDCPEPCVPYCEDLWCGDDGCGGSCSCPSSHPVCGSDNRCTKDSPDEVFHYQCRRHGSFGYCDKIEGPGESNCGPGYPDGARDCWGSSCREGQCIAVFTVGGEVRCRDHSDCSCTTNCVGKECGPDGCGGQCGTCGDCEVCSNGLCSSICLSNQECVNGVCTLPPTCVPNCPGGYCGPDGCGGYCGCSQGEYCYYNTCTPIAIN